MAAKGTSECANGNLCKYGGSEKRRNAVRGPTVPEMKVCEVLKLLRDDGWMLVTTRGSHRQFKHRIKSGRVTVAGRDSADLAPGTLNSILKQAGLKK